MSQEATIRAIVFDLGRVLIDVDPAETPRRWARALGGGEDQVVEALAGDTMYRRLERGQISVRQYHQHMMARLERSISYEDFLDGWNAMIGPVLPHVVSLLRTLSDSVRLVCLTNTNDAHAVKWRRTGKDILSFFERVFVSHEMGARKPENECFQQVLDYLALEPGEVLVVDDKASNVEAAQRMGMKGIVTSGPVDTITQLRELGLPVPGPAPIDSAARADS